VCQVDFAKGFEKFSSSFHWQNLEFISEGIKPDSVEHLFSLRLLTFNLSSHTIISAVRVKKQNKTMAMR